MRVFIITIAALALSACGQAARNSSAGDCAFETTREIAWPEGDLTLNAAAQSAGETCAGAELSLELRASDGAVLHRVAAPYYALAFGGAAPAEPPAVAREEVERFLAGWADLRPIRASALPEWREGAAQPGDGALPYRAAIARDAYERYRSANLPALCLAVRVDGVTCIVIEGAAAHAVLGYAE